MSKVFVVTQGEYSDYRIVGIFSTQEKAQGYIDQRKVSVFAGDYPDGHYIDEWELDGLAAIEMRPMYGVRIRIDTGAMEDLEPRQAMTTERETVSIIAERTEWSGRKPGFTTALDVYSAVSQEHARKLAAEERQAQLRVNSYFAGW